MNSTTTYRFSKYPRAFKAASLELETNLNKIYRRGKKESVARAVAEKYTAFHLTSPNDRKIEKDTLRVAFNRGNAGKTPANWGRPSIIPSKFTNTPSKQAIMIQVAGQFEAKCKSVVNTPNMLIVGTKWVGKINTNNAWRKVCTKHPEISQPVKVKYSEDFQVNWLSLKTQMTRQIL